MDVAVKYTNIGVILDRILRDHIFDGLSFEQAIDYTIDFFSIVGVPDMFEEKHIYFEFGKKYYSKDNVAQDYKAVLPDDFVDLVQLCINGVPARSATDTFQQFYDKIDTVSNYSDQYFNDKTYRRPADYTFKISNNAIFFSVKDGKVDMVYRAIKVYHNEDNPDDPFNGTPMIPDDPTFFRALKAYIEKEFLTILWRNGKITDKVYQDSKQTYAWAVGAYETSARRLDLSKAESFFNSYSTLVPRVNEFNNRFRNLGAKEILRRK